MTVTKYSKNYKKVEKLFETQYGRAYFQNRVYINSKPAHEKQGRVGMIVMFCGAYLSASLTASLGTISSLKM